MSVLTARKISSSPAAAEAEPINLYKLGMLFVVKCRYWSCRAGNDPDELDLTPDRIDARAIASFGTKDLPNPETTRKRFHQLEKRPRHALKKHSRPFAAANAHFVPWNHVQTVIDQLEALKIEFDQAVEQFVASYPALRAEWQAQHPDIPDGCYPLPLALPGKFNLSWHAFKVTGAPQLPSGNFMRFRMRTQEHVWPMLDTIESLGERQDVRSERLEYRVLVALHFKGRATLLHLIYSCFYEGNQPIFAFHRRMLPHRVDSSSRAI